MTALAIRSPSQTPCSPVCGSRYSANLEDKFWAALNFAIEGTLPCTAFDPKAPRTLVTASVSPVLPQKDSFLLCSPVQPRCADKHDRRSMAVGRPAQHPDKKKSGPLRVKVPEQQPSISITLTPTTAVPISTLSPSRARSQWHLRTPGGLQPNTPVLNLVSNFLDSVVRVSESRSSTPAVVVTVEPDGDTLIVESEVLIQVVEDINRSTLSSPIDVWNRTAFSSPIELRNRTAFNSPIEVPTVEKLTELQIPPSPIAVPAKMGYDIPSAFVANGPAGCAQELDAVWRMRWDRLFAREMYY